MKSNLFNFSHEVLLSCNQGELVPIGVTPVVPGDSVKHHTGILARVQPLLAPVYAKCDISIHHWFVPYRIIWDEWDDFWTGGPLGTSTPTPPTITAGMDGFAESSLADYLGFTPGIASLKVSALPFRAYNAIWNYYYRDQNLQTELAIAKTSGADSTTSIVLQNGAWERDYFTSARPEPQLGTDVAIPLTGDAPVVSDGSIPRLGKSGSASTNYGSLQYTSANGVILGAPVGGTISNGDSLVFGTITGLEADMSGVTAVEINDLRLAAALQRYKENLMRFGHRPIERLRAAFGVKPQDARMQEPEYLGGGRQTIQFSEVLQTSVPVESEELDSNTPLATMAGHGISAGRSNKYRRYIPEFGVIITVMCCRPRTCYPQAIHREWLKRTKEEFLQPELVNLGQQEVWDGEVYAGAASQYGTFGYQDRYDEYRRQESRVSGEFRSTLGYWHMARHFNSEPALNADFVKSNPTNRIYADQNSDQLYVRAIHSMRVKRRLPRVAKPKLF